MLNQVIDAFADGLRPNPLRRSRGSMPGGLAAVG